MQHTTRLPLLDLALDALIGFAAWAALAQMVIR